MTQVLYLDVDLDNADWPKRTDDRWFPEITDTNAVFDKSFDIASIIFTRAADCGANADGGGGFQPGNSCRGEGGGGSAAPKAPKQKLLASDDDIKKSEKLKKEAKRFEDMAKTRGADNPELQAVWLNNAKKARDEANRLETGGVAETTKRRAEPLVVAGSHKYADQIKPTADPLDTPEKSAAWHNQEFGAVTDAMAPEQVESIERYMGGDFSDINDGLRGTQKLNSENKATIQHLDNALAQTSLSNDVVLHRGVSDIAFLGDPTKLTGKTWTEKGYSSTSSMVSVADGFAGFGQSEGRVDGRFEITVKKGSQAVSSDVASGENSLHQHEVILPRNTKFKITGAEKRDLTNMAGSKVGEFWLIKAEVDHG